MEMHFIEIMQKKDIYFITKLIHAYFYMQHFSKQRQAEISQKLIKGLATP